MYKANGIIASKGEQNQSVGGKIMKGYNTETGFMGFINGTYLLFSCEEDYEEYMETAEEVA